MGKRGAYQLIVVRGSAMGLGPTSLVSGQAWQGRGVSPLLV